MSIEPSKPLILVDGSSYLYRAFHALPPLHNSRGEPTGAVLGVANMLRRLLDQYQPELIAVVFDAKGPTFRDDLFAAYKANRPAMPDELAAQIPPLHDFVRALGLPLLQISGVEADDVIGTLARQASALGLPVVISTGDKDMAQLVDPNITLINTMTNTVFDRQGVIDKFGVPPERIIDYLALIGDTSDNIPGVPKVGPKTAVKWLCEYGDLDTLMARAAEIPGKVGENLRASLEQLPLSHQLATIRCDVPLDCGPTDLKRLAPDDVALQALVTRLEFSAWRAQRPATAPVTTVVTAVAATVCATAEAAPEHTAYETVLNEARFDDWVRQLAAAELFAFDTETTSLDYMRAEIVGVSFAIEPGRAAYVPVAHDYVGAPTQLDRAQVLARLRPLLEDPHKAKLGQNLKYDMSVLANHGITLRGIRHDSMLESYVLDSTATRHDMDSLALKYLGHTTIHYSDVAGKGAKQIPFAQVALEQAGPYAAEDADITLRLHRQLWPQLRAQAGLRNIYEELEIPLVPVLSRMERTGVAIDRAMLKQQSGELAKRMQELEQRAYSAAGQPFNLGSPKQIQEILFDKLGIAALRKTKTGQASTGEDVLEELAEIHPLPRIILDYRGMSKLKSTYTDKLPEQIDARTGRVHTSYHQAVAATGRLSSSDPNLQNIPVRTEEGRRIRQAFIAPPGYRLLAADYSQIELRIMAHLSGDDALLRAFAAGQDIHSATAAEVFATAPEQVSADQRRAAKAINFGLIYGMSAFGLARQLGIDRGAAQHYVDLYFQRYPEVKAFMDNTRVQARAQGYVETVFGRRLYLPEINARNGQRRQYAERTAINAPMQGTAADIIKRAMLTLDHWIQTSGVEVKMVMQVHDELVFEVAEDALDGARDQIRASMVAAATLKVPLVVDIGIGKNWDEAH
ncbi:MAG: DNA polymerase I [Gammaproteobacteria bacterium]